MSYERLLDGKRLLITGVRSEDSLAYAVARAAQDAGAELVLTAPGRAMESARALAGTLPSSPPVLEFDVTVPEHVGTLREALHERWDHVDGVLHAIAFGPPRPCATAAGLYEHRRLMQFGAPSFPRRPQRVGEATRVSGRVPSR
jgi:enoyl-[acyl-carrier-protein] reductase (NADH)